MVEVTQEDREAAAIIYQRFRDYDYAGWILDGTNAMGDADSVIQAFACHRIAAEQRGKLEGARLTLEAAADRCDFLAQFPLTAREKLGASIRALDPAKIVGEG